MFLQEIPAVKSSASFTSEFLQKIDADENYWYGNCLFVFLTIIYGEHLIVLIAWLFFFLL